jgi:hypothetical protein
MAHDKDNVFLLVFVVVLFVHVRGTSRLARMSVDKRACAIRPIRPIRAPTSGRIRPGFLVVVLLAVLLYRLVLILVTLLVCLLLLLMGVFIRIRAQVLVRMRQGLVLDRARRRIWEDKALPPAHAHHAAPHLHETRQSKHVLDELDVHRQLLHAVERCYQGYRYPPAGIHLEQKSKNQIRYAREKTETHPLPEEKVLRHILRTEVILQLAQ